MLGTMIHHVPRYLNFMVVGGAIGLLACVKPPPVMDQLPVAGQPGLDADPIGAVGHGGFFDPKGKQIVPTEAFVATAQLWYRDKLRKRLTADKAAQFAEFEKRLTAGPKLQGQARLVVQQRMLDWLVANSPQPKADSRIFTKIAALAYELRWKLPVDDDLSALAVREPFNLDPDIAAWLERPESQVNGDVRLMTDASGAEYLEECRAAGVPIPPPIGQLDPAGRVGWKLQGFIPTDAQFIVGTPAEVRTYTSDQGMCIALPRYTDASLTAVKLDGVICLSSETSRVCFWDNQMRGLGFEYPSGIQIPIGVPDRTVNPEGLYMAGGAELEFGSGSVCTDCHAGENPYIIHPRLPLLGNDHDGDPTTPDLEMGELRRVLGLPTFTPNRYEPIVARSWPQNQASLAASYTPDECGSCHEKAAYGRLPHLSNELPFYCTMILPQALNETMPDGEPGSDGAPGSLGPAERAALMALCDLPPQSSTADYGDPHLATTNGIHYDFQAAGEFIALRNADGDFVLQTRQSPVSTNFTPGANAHTGLASCVSLNTAVALRIGSHRISYQPSSRVSGSSVKMQLRVDGQLVHLTSAGLDLGDGARISTADESGLNITTTEGTRVIITENFWASEGYWYLNIDVLHTTAREGIMGYIPADSWLPLAPDGSSFGPAPASLDDRHNVLNHEFADAWRVENTTSLFDYEPGTSTASYTDRDWPPMPGRACVATIDAWGAPAKAPHQRTPIDVETARQLCEGVVDDNFGFANCVFDVVATGHAEMAKAYTRAVNLRRRAAR